MEIPCLNNIVISYSILSTFVGGGGGVDVLIWVHFCRGWGWVSLGERFDAGGCRTQG